ncbi:hypothetical protein TREMEDRAFT_43066 [Tremella mesenterica DSM 1558]|uniref:uncharacterized protein n=1 Tax=Tremella mesenterica (strain ATCC 24925 / CBS 8224 / DSM 1558 / NBRC 9311 / NRRL Y-6157 / RJB 2259-6 / UBC 559-6) TaxID=578456 RepID=UPI0003F48F16|nr:uncharacterized protein TREMEDRAFT_43066 [Tremella mesenterica DSM 1558]EIW71812.1 hypothetical protein TREMEDRAFT_43066 [Tremella mesenterica DSM 1558]
MSAPLVTFKRPPRRPQTSRQRSPSPSSSSIPGPSSQPTVIRPIKKNLVNPLVQGTKRRRDTEETGGGLEELDYQAEENLKGSGDRYATRDSDWDLENGGDEDRFKVEKKVRLNEDGEIDTTLYHGMSNYLPTINKRTDVLDSKMKTGPIRATANVRTITLMDYQPDVCKPYKETGFCGYGDSCKFMHDRGDYLAGWQLDKLDPSDAKEVEQVDEGEDVPFACLICRKPFTEPVITKCGHYFCMNCAVARFVKSPKCYACGAPTSGIFNKAEKILAKMEARNQKLRAERGLVDEEAGGIVFGGGDEESEGDVPSDEENVQSDSGKGSEPEE